MLIRGLGHVAYKVKDFERSVEWYKRILGLEEIFRIYKDDGTLSIIYLKINDDNFIELFENPQGETPEAPPLGLQHLCLHVDDLAATLQELEKRGYAITGQIHTGRSGALQYWITDPDGNRLELMELVPGCKQLVGM